MKRWIFLGFFLNLFLFCEIFAQNVFENQGMLNHGIVKVTSGQEKGKSRIGTGFIAKIRPDAVYIVTSAQLVNNLSAANIRFYGGRGKLIKATVITGAETDDKLRGLALLKVTNTPAVPAGVIALQLDSLAKVKPGESLTLIGHVDNQQGWVPTQRTVTNRKQQDIYLDSNVSSGFLGGPMVMNGDVVGIMTSTSENRLGVNNRSVKNYVEDTIYKNYRNNRAAKSQASKEVASEPDPMRIQKMAARPEPAPKSNRNPLVDATGVWADPKTGMKFVWIKGGCFSMGCSTSVGDCESNEQPPHKVCVSSFWMGQSEVTQGQWMAVMDNNPSFFNKGTNYPVENISWNETQEFIEQLNNKGANKFRLPTEAEWEYACRSAGKRETYSGSDTVDDVAWYFENSGNVSHPVASKKPNLLGLFDMSGNVYEWVQDWYDEDFYQSSPLSNPVNSTAAVGRVLRGASWYSKATYTRCMNRNRYRPEHRNHFVGFRLVFEGHH